MAALTVEFPQTVWTVEFGGDEIVVAPVTMAPGAPGGGGAVDSVNGQTGVVVLDAGDVGADPAGTAAGLVDDLSGVTNAATARSNLGLVNVDNTSDANKPVSTAQQTALDGKAAASHSHSGADITSGTVSTARLGTGAANATTFLRGDQTWAAAGGSETLPASIIDAKGDVIVGTAADTAARLAVGADGQVLTADSGEASGVKWAAGSEPEPPWAWMPRPYPMQAGYWIGLRTQTEVMNEPVGTLLIMRLWLPPSFDRIAIHASSGGDSTFRLGWYEANPTTSLIDWSTGVDCGTVNTTSIGVAMTTLPGGTLAGDRWVFAACLRETSVSHPTLQTSRADPDLRGLRYAIHNESVAGMRATGVSTGSLPTAQPGNFDVYWRTFTVFARVA